MQYNFEFKGQTYTCRDQETLLAAFHRYGLVTPFSCRKGICGTCMLRALPGQAPKASQKGLRLTLQEKGYFLPCICIPDQNITIEAPNPDEDMIDTKRPASAFQDDMLRDENGELCDPPPDLELWAVLQEGTLLNTILDDFYTQAYADPELSPFFKGVTKKRAVEKQYNFLYQIFSGQKVYFGEKPKTGHHWMVISDELMTRREEMMAHCLRKHGLSEHLVIRWREMEERYRQDIVKSEAWPKVVFGEELSVEGYDEVELSIGTMCDSCEGEAKAGETVRYHLRLGTIACPRCMQNQVSQKPIGLT